MKKSYISPSVEELSVGHGISVLETLSTSGSQDDYLFEDYLEDWVDDENA